jgi:hypothetical protein
LYDSAKTLSPTFYASYYLSFFSDPLCKVRKYSVIFSTVLEPELGQKIRAAFLVIYVNQSSMVSSFVQSLLKCSRIE